MVTSTCLPPTPHLPLQVHPCNFLIEVDRGGGGQEFYNCDGEEFDTIWEGLTSILVIHLTFRGRVI